MPKQEYLFDKVSGLQGCVFGLSVCPEIARENDEQNPYKFDSYAQRVHVKEEQAEEFLGNEWCERQVERIISDSMDKGAGYFRTTARSEKKRAEEFEKYSKKLLEKIKICPDAELVKEYEDFCKKYFNYYGLGAVTFVYESILSDIFFRELSAKHQNAALLLAGILTVGHESFMIQSQRLLAKIREEKGARKKEILADEYLEKFFYIKANYADAPILTRGDVFEMSEQIFTNSEAGKSNNQIPVLDKRLRVIAEILKETGIIRDDRKKLNVIGSYMLFRFIDEAVRRTKIKREIAKRAFWFEYKDIIFVTENFKKSAAKRETVSLVWFKNKTNYLEYDAIKERGTEKNIKEISGTPASPGKATGKIRIVLGSGDFAKFRKGEILVTEMTRPEFVTIMHGAAAVITNEGGLTCHAAIVSRELGIPCVVGAKIATKIFKDGDEVAVDANNGTVKLIKNR